MVWHRYARLRTGYWVRLIAQVSAREGGINGMSRFRAVIALVRSYRPTPLAAAAIGEYVTSRVSHGHYWDYRPCQTLLYCIWAWQTDSSRLGMIHVAVYVARHAWTVADAVSGDFCNVF